MGMFTNFSDIMAMARLYMEKLRIVSIIYILNGWCIAVNLKKHHHQQQHKIKRKKGNKLNFSPSTYSFLFPASSCIPAYVVK